MKKGYTLIELSISVALLAMLSTIVFEIFIKLGGFERDNIKKANSTFYIQEALMFIEREISDDTESITVADNKIETVKNDKLSKNIICLEDGKLKIIYKVGNSNYIKSTNTVLNNLYSFSAVKYESVIYVMIKMKNGEYLERCFGGKNIK